MSESSSSTREKLVSLGFDQQRDGRFELSRSDVRDLDLRFADGVSIRFRNCAVSDVLFPKEAASTELCWCDVTDCDFANATLRNSHFYGSIFARVCFERSEMHQLDLSRAVFRRCSFVGSSLLACQMTYWQRRQLVRAGARLHDSRCLLWRRRLTDREV